MDQATAEAIRNLLQKLLDRSDGIATAALITVMGMAAVAILTSITQWRLTRTAVRSELTRMREQISSEFRLRQFELWQSRFQETIADLLKETDIEANRTLSRERIVPLVLRAQLMLNLNEASHCKVNDLINQLALAVNGWQGSPDASHLLLLHGALLDASREILSLPSRPV